MEGKDVVIGTDISISGCQDYGEYKFNGGPEAWYDINNWDVSSPPELVLDIASGCIFLGKHHKSEIRCDFTNFILFIVYDLSLKYK